MKTNLATLQKFIPPSSEFINLAMNENYFLDWSLQAKNYHNESVDSLAFYGNSQHQKLREVYANINGINANQIVPSAGSDSLIPILLNALAKHKVLRYEDDFFRYDDACMITNHQIDLIKNDCSDQEVIDYINNNDIEVFIFSNPCNPIGCLKSTTAIEKIVSSVKAYVIVDEAYVDYANENCLELIEKYDNLIVLRTLSKAYGMANLRVGFIITNEKLANYLDTIKGPFSLSDYVSDFAAYLLQHQDVFEKAKSNLIKVRDKFLRQLSLNNLEVKNSQSNFVYLEGIDANGLSNHLKDHQIIVSRYKEGLRITIGQEKIMDQVFLLINQYLNERGN